MFEAQELLTNPTGAAQALRLLGVNEIRLVMYWDSLAPDPTSRTTPQFQATNPAAYPAAAWAQYDAVISAATQAGIGVNLDPGGRAPLWAQAKNAPAVGQGSWYPSASDFQAFVEAVGKRYSGTYTPPGAS
ncbi:MAG TPA: cellulase family glycosylhydrolase, partial [Solirubrobacteraceae bacterium]|nr:cellulase family glycosylhydrolase [Solirubrobacteraceae bacterium]